MEKLFKNKKDGTLEVSVAYTQEEYVPVLNKVAQKLAENVQIKGFRKGKAPLDRAMAYIKNEDLYDGMVKKLINRDFPTLLDGYEESSKVANVQPALNVDYDDKKKVYTFVYKFVFLPEVELSQYKGLGIKTTINKTSDSEIDSKIEALRKDQAELVPSTEESKMGDTVNIDFTGFIDNKPFDGGSAKAYDLVLGSNSFIPGFEEELVGLKEGARKSFKITFPENYVAALASKEARFDIVVNSVKAQVLPELDDEFVKSLEKYDVDTLEALKAKIKEELDHSHETEAKNVKLNAILDDLAAKSKFVIAPEYIKVTADSISNERMSQISQYGLGKAEYLKLVGMTEEQFDEDSMKQAERDAKGFAIMKAVADAEKLAVTDEDLAKVFGGKDKYEELVTRLSKEGNNAQVNSYLNQIRSNLLNNKVQDFLYENN